MSNAKFVTTVNCMDGRTQIPVNTYLKKKYSADYVDTITEAGPNLILAEGKPVDLLQSILNRLKISIEAHQSVGVAIVGHHDCAANSASRDDQVLQIQQAINRLSPHCEGLEIIGLWVDSHWEVHQIG